MKYQNRTLFYKIQKMEDININKISDQNNSLKQIHNLYFSDKYRETIALCDLVLGNSKQIIEILNVKAGYNGVK